jgi:signal transduction histidine kinase
MVPRDSLGIFDTPPDRKQIRFGLLVAVLLVAAFLLILPVRDVPRRRIDGFMPAIDAILFVGDSIKTTLLFAQGSVFRSRALMALAAGYLYSALLLIAHALRFPGAFWPTGSLDADVNTTGWIATLQRLAFPIVIIQYVQFKRVETAPRLQRERPEGAGLWIAAAVSLAIAVILLTTARQDLLPPFYSNRAQLIYTNSVAYQSLMFALLLVAVTMLVRMRSSVLDLWLLVASFGWLIQTLLIMTLHARSTAGFYCLYGIVVASHLVVMIALVAESNRLYARLALSTTSRDVEREARLMSMDAVAAAIATHVGQSLAAISLSASVGTCSLKGRKPNVEKAIAALGEISDSDKRSFEMVASVRSIFAKAPEAAGEFSLNELIDETAPLLDSELAASKIAPKLRLGEEMPLMRGSRVQLQQVLLALAKNATQSAGTNLNRQRTFTVRSRVEGRKIMLQVSDHGMGVTPEEVPHLFDAIQNDDAGTSIGLSLCRSIVEEHGGRIGASHDDELGATFHVEFPASGSVPSAHALAS